MVDTVRPFLCQLAIQGGGAKLVALVAALAAAEELENEGLIKVTRIAGTSAGAIAGTLFAARVPMAVVKSYLERVNIRQLLPELYRWQMLWRFWRGQPFWDTDKIRKELQNLLKHGKVSGITVGDLAKPPGVPIYITATDLRNSGLRICGDNEAIVNALLDSCALPIVLRAARSPASNIVDGGICENLPSQLLTEHVSTDGPVLGFSFVPKSSDTPKTVFEFCKALLDTAINNSMIRAKRSLGDAVYNITTDIDTFDFEMAFSDGLRAEYENVHIKTRDFIVNFVDLHKNSMNSAGTKYHIEPISRIASLGEAQSLLLCNYLQDLLETLMNRVSELDAVPRDQGSLMQWYDNLLGMLWDLYSRRQQDIYTAWLRPTDAKPRRLRLFLASNLRADYEHYEYSFGEGFAGKVWSTHTVAATSRARQHPWWVFRRGCENTSYICAPVGGADGPGGVVAIGSNCGFDIDEADINIAKVFASLLALAVSMEKGRPVS